MKRLVWLVAAVALACGDPEPVGPGAKVETLVPEPAGAPTAAADGRLGCLGDNAPKPVSGSTIELLGWVRALSDRDAMQTPPQGRVTAYTAGGGMLGETFVDRGKKGRVTLSVPIQSTGFTGHIVVSSTAAGFLDYRFSTSRAVTSPTLAAWAWLTTPAEADAKGTAVGVTRDPNKGILYGGVLDCDAFGVANAVVQVNGSTDGVLYVEGFEPSASATFTTSAGRFVAANVSPGKVTIKAFARPEAGGELELLSSIDATVEAQKITAVALEPRVGIK